MSILAFFIISVFARDRLLLKENWLFESVPNESLPTCDSSNFPRNLTGIECDGLHHEPQYLDAVQCEKACCNREDCEVWLWCDDPHKEDLEFGEACSPFWSCWLGRPTECKLPRLGWAGRARDLAPIRKKEINEDCKDPKCKVDFDDSKWRKVEVPHDFVVETDFSEKEGHYSRGYKIGQIAWYRLHFQSPKGANKQVAWIDFEGVQRNYDIYFNGKFLGHQNSGYIGVQHYLHLNPSGENVLAVKLDARETEGWWYDGGGIYRHVWLTIANPLHIAPYGVFANITIGTIGALFAEATIDAQVTVSNKAANEENFYIKFQLLDRNGFETQRAESDVLRLEGNTKRMFKTDITVPDAELWSPESPTLYTLRTTIMKKGKDGPIDSIDTTIGFRKISVDPNRGFILNDRKYVIRGVANHQDFAGVGVAVPDSLQKFRVSKMKEMGANAWRMTHNPPNPALLDECDRQGMLVVDENHRNYIHDQYLDDFRGMILRDRNHPSVVMWSICNERLCMEWNNANARTLYEVAEEMDSGPNRRPILAAVDDVVRGGLENGENFLKIIDVIGLNYRTDDYNQHHWRFPDKMVMGSETASALGDRGVYKRDKSEHPQYINAYDENSPFWANTAQEAWIATNENIWFGGCFVWTGFDFKGETTPYQWPNVNSHFGILDIAGFPKDSFHYYQQNWKLNPETTDRMLHCFPHWNWEKHRANKWALPPCVKRCDEGLITEEAHGSKCDKICVDKHGDVYVEVWAYSNAKRVDLFVNGMKLGKSQTSSKDGHISWLVEYIPGTLECRAYDEYGRVINKHTIKTAGSPAALKIEIEQGENGLWANKDDVALIKVIVVDSEGIMNPLADNMIHLEIYGPARIIGVGNGDPSCHEPDKATSRSAFNGLMRGIIQSTFEIGEIAVIARSAGLKPAMITLKSRTPKQMPQVFGKDFSNMKRKYNKAANSIIESWEANHPRTPPQVTRLFSSPKLRASNNLPLLIVLFSLFLCPLCVGYLAKQVGLQKWILGKAKSTPFLNAFRETDSEEQKDDSERISCSGESELEFPETNSSSYGFEPLEDLSEQGLKSGFPSEKGDFINEKDFTVRTIDASEEHFI